MSDSMDVDSGSPIAKLFARAPVYVLIFACLSPRSLAQLASTCRAAYLAVAGFKSRAFSINRHLFRYFSNPIAFRSLQAKTNTLISGSNVLQFLDRSFYPEADLDLYTHPGHSFEVAQFLVEMEGYNYAPRASQKQDWKEATKSDWDPTRRRVEIPMGADRAYLNSDIREVWSFEKVGGSQERLAVQIIEASSSPLESILGFHSTCVMNFITSDAAYALYPVATFEDRCAIGLPSLGHHQTALAKYIERGWRIYFLPTPSDEANPHKPPFLLEEVRWVADRHTWVLPLDTTGVAPRPPLSSASAPLTCDPALFNGWRLGAVRGRLINGLECQYYPLQSTLFRYNYAIPDEKLSYNIRSWASIQGWRTHGRVSKENWMWFDADMPGFLQRG